VFLGEYNEFDLYYCGQPTINCPTIIARNGEEDNYYSGMIFTGETIKELLDEDIIVHWNIALRVGYLIARDRGLVL